MKITNTIKQAFHQEFHCVSDRFVIIEESVNNAYTSKADFVYHPGVYVFWKDDKIIKIVPNHDILLGGFPCQPFSIAGVSKKKSLGRAHGFKDEHKEL